MGDSSPPSVEWLEDVSAADWIGPQLHPVGQDTGSIIPEGFEVYARLFHPAESHGPDGRRWRWGDIAARHGQEVHPELFDTISHPPGGVASDDDRGEPELGSLPLPERAVLVDLLRPATTTPDDCWFCVWDGFGSLDTRGVTARVRLPWREYVVRRGPIEAAMDPTPRRRGPGSIDMIFTKTPAPGAPAPDPPVLPEVWWKDQSPNLWWPADRAWIVASEIDHTWTYIGGPAALIRSILDHTDLEALPVELTDWP